MAIVHVRQPGDVRRGSANITILSPALSISTSFLMVGLALLGGCTASHQVSAPDNKSSTIPQELIATQNSTARQAIAAGALIVDVRTPTEFNDRHLQNAVNIPLSQIAERITSIEPNRSRAIVVYCNRGHRAEAARVQLEGLGYTKVIHGGGLQDF